MVMNNKFYVLERKAKSGDANAMYEFGLLFYDGKIVEQDFRRAKEWFEKAAELGNANAMYFLGEMYRNGEGVKQDYQKAIE